MAKPILLWDCKQLTLPLPAGAYTPSTCYRADLSGTSTPTTSYRSSSVVSTPSSTPVSNLTFRHVTCIGTPVASVAFPSRTVSCVSTVASTAVGCRVAAVPKPVAEPRAATLSPRAPAISRPASAGAEPVAASRSPKPNRINRVVINAGLKCSVRMSELKRIVKVLERSGFNCTASLKDLHDVVATRLGIPSKLARAIRDEIDGPAPWTKFGKVGLLEDTDEEEIAERAPVSLWSREWRLFEPCQALRRSRSCEGLRRPSSENLKQAYKTHVTRQRSARGLRHQELHSLRISGLRRDDSPEPWVETTCNHRSSRAVMMSGRARSMDGMELARRCWESTQEVAATKPDSREDGYAGTLKTMRSGARRRSSRERGRGKRGGLQRTLGSVRSEGRMPSLQEQDDEDEIDIAAADDEGMDKPETEMVDDSVDKPSCIVVAEDIKKALVALSDEGPNKPTTASELPSVTKLVQMRRKGLTGSTSGSRWREHVRQNLVVSSAGIRTRGSQSAGAVCR